MCYSPKASILSYSLGTILSILCFFITTNKYYKHISLFVLCFTQIQLAEYFLWNNQTCNKINKYITITIEALLYLQPLVIFISGYFLKTFTFSNKILFGLIGLCLLPYLDMLHYYSTTKDKICSLQHKQTGHLKWAFKHKQNLNTIAFLKDKLKWVVYTIFIVGNWLFLKDKIIALITFFVGVVSFFYSKFTIQNKYGKLKIKGISGGNSNWCYIAVYLSIGLLFCVLKDKFY